MPGCKARAMIPDFLFDRTDHSYELKKIQASLDGNIAFVQTMWRS